MKVLAQRIRQRRLELGLRQSDLARVLHTSPQAVSKWERGTNDPDLIHLPGLARLLQVTVDWLLAVDGGSSDAAGTIVFIGVSDARLRGSQLSPPAFMAWCQGVLDRSIACVAQAHGQAVTPRGPGLLAAFTGADHQAHAWQAVAASCQVHAVPLKIGCASGSFHHGEVRLGASHQVADVFGEPVTVALRLSDWVATQHPVTRVARHALAWRGTWPLAPRGGLGTHARLVLDEMVITDVHMALVTPGRRPPS